MKTFTSSITLSSLFFFGVSCFAAGASPSDTTQIQAKAKFLSLMAHFRLLQLSQTCQDALEGLSNNKEFRVANATKFQEAATLDVTRFCKSSSNKVNCNLYYDDLRSHDRFADACEATGGRLVPTRVGLHCSVDGGTVKVVVNDQECIPSACSAEELDQYLQKFVGELADHADGLAPRLGGSGSCRFSRVNLGGDIVTSGATSTTNFFGFSVVALLGALATMMHVAI